MRNALLMALLFATTAASSARADTVPPGVLVLANLHDRRTALMDFSTYMIVPSGATLGVCAGRAIDFFASAGPDADGLGVPFFNNSTLIYAWSFGSGTLARPLEVFSPTASVTFRAHTTVSLMVFDGAGNAGSFSAVVQARSC